MKRILSFSQIASKYIFLKLLGILVLMSGIEAFLYLRMLKVSTYEYPLSLKEIYNSSHLTIVFIITFLLVIILLTLQGTAFGSKFGYTLMRLSIKEESLMLIWSGYYFLCMLSVLLTQTLLNYIFNILYVNHMDSIYVNNQTIFMNFYRIPLIHSLLPLSEPFNFIMLILLLFALSLTIAYFSYRLRHGRKSILYSYMTVSSVILLPMNDDSLAISLLLFFTAVLCILYILYSFFWGVKPDET